MLLRRAVPVRRPVSLLLTVVALLAVAVAAGQVASTRNEAAAQEAIYAGPIPQAACDAGSNPETSGQGRISTDDIDSGRAAEGYRCNTEQVGRFGGTGGFQVHRYVDAAGHECAFFDSTLLFPKDLAANAVEGTGVFVLDMTDPANPVKTANLVTPAMLSPHESLRLNQERGLLAAVMGYPSTNPGIVDIYDVTEDCRTPVLKSSLPLSVFGHESGFAPDGNTFYVTGTSGPQITAIDVTDPTLPTVLFTEVGPMVHGMSLSDDGNRLYAADIGNPGLTIYDTSQIQAREALPQMPVISRLSWPEVSIPQNTIPISRDGRDYLVEVDEYTSSTTRGPLSASTEVGAARIIDITDETAPKVVSNMRLAVHQDENRAGEQSGDPGANSPVQGYAGHYCNTPTRVSPTIAACSMIVSGLRIFDIRDPDKPVEVGYFNAPVLPGVDFVKSGAFAMSAPTFVPDRNEVWYSDGNSGFYVVRLTGAALAAFRDTAPPVAAPPVAAPPVAGAPPVSAPPAPAKPGSLASTGLPAALPWLGLGALSLVGAAVLRRRTIPA